MSTSIEIRVPKATKILSIKIDSYIDHLLDQAARQLNFESKSAFIRYVLCNILLDLGLLEKENEYLCYHGGYLVKKRDDDPDLLIAIANVVARLRGLAFEEATSLVASYAELLSDVSA